MISIVKSINLHSILSIISINRYTQARPSDDKSINRQTPISAITGKSINYFYEKPFNNL